MPKDRAESQAVYNIIQTFKEHMHPELSKGGYFYIYPSEFEIVYYHNNCIIEKVTILNFKYFKCTIVWKETL